MLFFCGFCLLIYNNILHLSVTKCNPNDLTKWKMNIKIIINPGDYAGEQERYINLKYWWQIINK